MTIDYNFIKQTSDVFRAHAQTVDLCPTRNMRPDNANYACYEYQLVYGARYLPAYYVEYYDMATLLASRLAGHSTGVNIMSLGCGLCQDYHALTDALSGVVSFNYWGYDITAWDAFKIMPPPGTNFSYLNSGVQFFRPLNVAGIDAFVFPKSLSDIDPVSMAHLASVIATTDRSRLFFLNSYVRNGGQPYGSLGTIHNALIGAGFTQAPTLGPYHISADRITDRYPKFDSCVGKISCPKFSITNANCSNCEAVKYPMLSGNYSYFELREYVRP